MGIRLREIATARRDVATVPRTRLGEAIYVSAKRTHFIDAPYSMHHFYLQKLMSFAMDFANGFVLEKRTHLEGVGGVVFIEKWVLFRKVKPLGDSEGDVPSTFRFEMDLQCFCSFIR